jgi:NAD(P)-dependent dehydrogenase (short-subunit alcohol dehydrogenase family)
MAALSGAQALVTGGAHRLGRAIALALAQAGADVVIHYHQSAQKAERTLADLRALGVRADAIQGDLSQTAEAERVVDQAIGYLGGLSILVNNAGIWGPTPIGEVSEARWDELLNTNLRGAFFTAQRAAPALRAAHGAIVNIADVGVVRPWSNHVPYLVSKGGVVTLTHALARDLAPEVRVNAIAPGAVLMPDDWDEQRSRSAAESTLLKRVGSPEDIGQAAVFLASAPYITGVVLPVDGGRLLQ